MAENAQLAAAPAITQRIAHWAASFLASSLVLVLGVFAIAFWMASPAAWVQDRPMGALLLAVLLFGYLVAFICLSRLKKAQVRNPLGTWLISLLGTCAPLAVLMYLFDDYSTALVIGMAEVASAVLQLLAIAIVLRGASPTQSALKRASLLHPK